MGKEDNALVTWFRRSLLFHKLQVKEITSPQALGEAFGSLAVGLTFYFAVLAIGAVAAAVLINSDNPARIPRANSSPVPYVAVGVAVGGAIAAVVLWRNRHKKYKDVSFNPSR